MPSIPVYNSPQVDRAAVSGAKQQTGGVNAVAFGASDTFDQAERMASTYVQQQEKEGERKAAEEALRAQSGFQREVIGKQNEWRQRQGKNAEGIDKEADAWMAETAGKYIEELKDPRAIQLFDQKAMQQRNNMLDWSTGHVTQQREIALDVELNSAKQVAIDTAINDSRPEIVSQSIADIQQKNAFNAKRKGYDDTWIQAQNTKDISKMHDQILQNAIDQDSVGGVSGYLQAHGDSIDKGTRAKAEKWVHNKVIDETAGSYADTLIGSGVSYSDALAGAREKFSGEDEDKYVRKIKERFGEVEQIKRQQAEDIQNDFYKQLAQTDDVTQIPDEQIIKLTEADPKAGYMITKQKEAALEVKARGGDFAKETDVETAKHLDDKILNGDIKDPNELKAYRGTLTQSDYNSYQNAIEKQGLLSSTNAVAAYKDYLPAEKKKKGYVETMDDRAREAQFIKDAADYVKETHRPQDLKAFAANWHLQGEVDSGAWYKPNKTMALGDAVAQGKADKFAPIKPLEDNALTHDYLNRGAEKQVVKTGMANGRKVVQYSDGSIEYAQ